MSSSVALACYNGAAYLREQLDSIREQTTPPDEVIIVDDCSTDASYDIVETFISEYRLETWKLIRNKHNLGWRGNFIKSFSLANGDLIYPCDQDDIWLTSKISDMNRIMNEKPEIEVLVSNLRLLNLSNSDKISSMYYGSNDASVSKLEFSSRFMSIRRPGCVFCFRAELREAIKDVWKENQAHDALLWRLGMVRGSLYYYDAETIIWRRHSGCATLDNQNLWEKRCNYYRSWQDQCNYFLSWLQSNQSSDSEYKVKIIRRYLEMINLIFSINRRHKAIDYFKLLLLHNVFPSSKSAFKEAYLLFRKI